MLTCQHLFSWPVRKRGITFYSTHSTYLITVRNVEYTFSAASTRTTITSFPTFSLPSFHSSLLFSCSTFDGLGEKGALGRSTYDTRTEGGGGGQQMKGGCVDLALTRGRGDLKSKNCRRRHMYVPPFSGRNHLSRSLLAYNIVSRPPSSSAASDMT